MLYPSDLDIGSVGYVICHENEVHKVTVRDIDSFDLHHGSGCLEYIYVNEMHSEKYRVLFETEKEAYRFILKKLKTLRDYNKDELKKLKKIKSGIKKEQKKIKKKLCK